MTSDQIGQDDAETEGPQLASGRNEGQEGHERDALTSSVSDDGDPGDGHEAGIESLQPFELAGLFNRLSVGRLIPALGTAKLAVPQIPNLSKAVLSSIPDVNQILGQSALSKLVAMPDIAKAVMPAYASLVPRYNVSTLAGLDLAALQSQLDVLKGAGTADFAARLIDLDISRLIPRIDFEAIARQLRQQWQAAKAPNWPDDSIDSIELIAQIVSDEGLPLVWIPRAEIVKELLIAESREARVALLLARRDDVVADCREVLADVHHARLHGQLPLAVSALDSLAQGHGAPAQALAVLVTETAIKRAISGTYKDVKNSVKFDVDDVPFTAFRSKAALAPIGSFFTTWFPDGTTPPPAQLSRHVSVHQADSVHYTEENAIISVLLMTSILRALESSWALEDPQESAES